MKISTVMNVRNVTRVEVIDKDGRSYVNWDAKKVVLSLQDGGKTLKVMISE
jgi:hypothetical protein